MQIPRRAKIAGVIGATLLATYAAIGLRGFDFSTYHGRYGGTLGSEYCSYELTKETKHQGLFGFRDGRTLETFWDDGCDGTVDMYKKNRLTLDRRFTSEWGDRFIRYGHDDFIRTGTMTDEKGNKIGIQGVGKPYERRIVIPGELNSSRIMTIEEERETQRKFEQALSHIPEDDPYLAAVDKQ